jgi:transposase-like protein
MSRRIPKEIKEEIIGKVQAGERVADLAEQYAVSTKTIYTWLRQDTGEAVVSVLQYNKLKRENEELKRLIGELTLNMHLQKKVEIVRQAKLKTVCAEALGINRKNIYRQLKLPAKDHALKQPAPTPATGPTLQYRLHTPSYLP